MKPNKPLGDTIREFFRKEFVLKEVKEKNENQITWQLEKATSEISQGTQVEVRVTC